MKFLIAVIAAFLATLSGSVWAQSYPTRPVRVTVSFAAGTGSDIAARLIATQLQQTMGQPFIVENRPGAGGTIGFEYAAKAAPDGYNLLVAPPSLAVSKWVGANIKYDPATDFIAISMLSQSPLVLAANPGFGPKTMRELIGYVKANPGKVNYGASGLAPHLTGEKLKLDTGIDMQHVPYKGTTAVLSDLMGGQIPLVIDNIFVLLPHFKSEKIRPLAVSSAKRHPMLPDVPTFMEAGVRDFEIGIWYGFFAPAGTPREIVTRLNTEIVKALAIPDVRQKLIDVGSEILGNSPEAANAMLRKEIDRWGVVVKAANIKPQ